MTLQLRFRTGDPNRIERYDGTCEGDVRYLGFPLGYGFVRAGGAVLLSDDDFEVDVDEVLLTDIFVELAGLLQEGLHYPVELHVDAYEQGQDETLDVVLSSKAEGHFSYVDRMRGRQHAGVCDESLIVSLLELLRAALTLVVPETLPPADRPSHALLLEQARHYLEGRS